MMIIRPLFAHREDDTANGLTRPRQELGSVRENRTIDLSQFCLQIIPALAHSFTGYKCTPGFRIIRAADDFLLSNDTTTSRQLRTCRVFETCHWFMPCARLAIPLFLSFLSLSLSVSLPAHSLARSIFSHPLRPSLLVAHTRERRCLPPPQM